MELAPRMLGMALTTPVELIVQALDVRMVRAMPVAPAGDSAAPARLVTAAVVTAVATVKPGVANTEAGVAAARRFARPVVIATRAEATRRRSIARTAATGCRVGPPWPNSAVLR